MRSQKNVAVCIALLLLLTPVASARADQSPAAALKQRYPLSRVELENARVQGTVVRPGACIRLEADAIAAKPFHVIQLNTKSPRFHVRDYARVAVASGKLVTLETGDLTLRRGTELVVLDIKVQGDTVRLFTHTAKPLADPAGHPTYGCTEFVFRFDARIASSDVARVQQTIDRWLAPA